MNIKITKIVGGNEVEFSTEIGNGIATLTSVLKATGEDGYIEFDIGGKLEIGKNVEIVPQRAFFIRHHGDINSIQGVVDAIDAYDGLIYLRLSADCLIMVTIDSPKQTIREGDFLCLAVGVNNLRLT